MGKVFCGVQATGRGHLSRYGVVREMLQRCGHEVYGFASGQELPGYECGIQKFEPGPTFFIRNNRIDLLKSCAYNATRAPGFLRAFFQVRRDLREGGYDHAVVDFEPLSARSVTASGVPFTIFDNQTFSLLPHEDLPGAHSYLLPMRQFVKLYYGPALKRATRILTYSLVPAQSVLPQQVIVPPCIRQQVRELEPSPGNHLLFYSSVGLLPEGLIEFARVNPEAEVRAYVAGVPADAELPPNLKVPSRDSSSFLEDFASCRGYVSNAGFESVAEAIWLGKPMMIVPIQGQWEQNINAMVIRQRGIGDTALNFDRETFERAWNAPVSTRPEIRQWVEQGRETLERELCGAVESTMARQPT